MSLRFIRATGVSLPKTETARSPAPFHRRPRRVRLAYCRPVALPLAAGARRARLGGLAALARRRGGKVARAAHGGKMREEAAGADARIVRHALDDADQHVALAIEFRDRTARVAHAGAGADRAMAVSEAICGAVVTVS